MDVVEEGDPGISDFSGPDLSTELFLHDLHGDASGLIELLLGRRVLNVKAGRGELLEQRVNQRHIVNVLDEESEAEEAVVSGLEEELVVHQLVLGNASETREHSLSLGVELEVSK